MDLLLWAVPVFIVTMFIEWRLTLTADVQGYRLKDTAACLSMGLGNLAVMGATKAAVLGIFIWLYEFRLFEIPTNTWWAWALLLLSEDFCYYWFHRFGHVVRFFWAAHVNHHSATSYNLSTALRQSWTGPLIGWVFWVPLPLLGFDPLMIITAQAISLLYQYWIHTELIDTMGPLEWVLNTPSHHRVHHGTDPLYLDRNYAGILIIWDRLFGTFEPETHRPSYGLTTNLETYHPVRIAFHEWAAILRDLRSAKTWRGRLGALFAPPGWREDGSGTTSEVLRARALSVLTPSEASSSQG
jgi:sterol desaturase/sphingolipid hydroxylase (fatty acid hydroxylase superfamily)